MLGNHPRLFANKNCLAPGEARTHGLQIMRLTRCLLIPYSISTRRNENSLSEVGFEPTPSYEDQNSL